MLEKYKVYLVCPAFPGQIRIAVVEANHYKVAKLVALGMYPGHNLL